MLLTRSSSSLYSPVSVLNVLVCVAVSYFLTKSQSTHTTYGHVLHYLLLCARAKQWEVPTHRMCPNCTVDESAAASDNKRCVCTWSTVYCVLVLEAAYDSCCAASRHNVSDCRWVISSDCCSWHTFHSCTDTAGVRFFTVLNVLYILKMCSYDSQFALSRFNNL